MTTEDFKAYTPVPFKRNCGETEGSTHWMGCDCHEERHQKELSKVLEMLATERDKFGKIETELWSENSKLKSALSKAREALEDYRATHFKVTSSRLNEHGQHDPSYLAENKLKETLSEINQVLEGKK